MTKLFTNFESADVGDNPPADWTRRGAAASSPANYLFTVANGSPPFKRRQLTVRAVGTDPSPLLTWDEVDALADRRDLNVHMVVARPLVDEPERIIATTRYVEVSGNPFCYEFSVELSSNRVRIYKVSAGVRTNPFSDFAFDPIAAGSHRKFTFQISGAAPTLLKVKCWDEFDEEPTAWGLEVSDGSGTDISVAGSFGVSIKKFGFFTYSECPINFVSVGTGGEAAYVPRLNGQYSAWLKDQTAKRRVVAILRAFGYDPDSPTFTKTVYAYMADGGYTSKPFDAIPNQYFPPIIKSVPSFSREMGIALYGRAVTNIGSLKIFNPKAEPFVAPSLDAIFLEEGGYLLTEDGDLLLQE